MATSSMKTVCVVCNKEKITYLCHGCSRKFCLPHLTEHRQDLALQLEQLENDHDGLRQKLHDQQNNQIDHPLMNRIDQWEKNSIAKIKRTADQCRTKLITCANVCRIRAEKKLNHLAEQMRDMRQENEFNEIDLNELKIRIRKLEEELVQSADISMEQTSTAFVNSISVRINEGEENHERESGEFWQSLI